MNTQILETEILIIGSGISGLAAAIFAAEAGFKVAIISRGSSVEESNTWHAQGGIIFRGKNDTEKILANDIFLAGDRIGNLANIKLLAKDGPKIVKNFLIDRLKIPFSKEPSGKLHFTLEGGHSKNRIIHIADETGRFIEESLFKELKKYPNVKILTQHTAIDLITPSHHSTRAQFIYEPLEVVGAYVLDNNLKKVKIILSQQTILATGGAGWLFLYTTNPEGARGDGIAMASRAGARIINLEFIQFHPTCFEKKDAPRFLISETVRGEGAVLLNEFKEPFMKKYNSKKDLAPRDEVCQAMYREMLETRTEKFFLDLTPLKNKGVFLKKRFPFIHQQCLKYGINIENDLIPVVPAAHYTCGGIWTDSWGKTTLGNLYAIGETSCTGIHGANRLASTSLLEGLLWGKRCIENIRKQKKYQDIKKFQIPAWLDTGIETPDNVLLLQDWLTLRTTMWNYVGVVRSQKRLERAKEDLTYLENRIEKFYKETKITDSIVGLRNGARVARLITEAAFKNKKSQGCHYRLD